MNCEYKAFWKKKNQCTGEKTGAENIVKEIKLPGKVATTHTEDGHKRDT